MCGAVVCGLGSIQFGSGVRNAERRGEPEKSAQRSYAQHYQPDISYTHTYIPLHIMYHKNECVRYFVTQFKIFFPICDCN